MRSHQGSRSPGKPPRPPPEAHAAALAIRLTAAQPEGSATDQKRDLVKLDSRTKQAVGATANRKAKSLIIPQVDLEDKPLTDAIEFLRQEAARLCAAEPEPDQRGINIFVKVPRPVMARATTPQDTGKTTTPQPSPEINPLLAASALGLDARPITLTLRRRSLLEILRAMAAQVNMKVKVERYAASFVPATEQIESMSTAEFTVALDALGSPASSPLQGGGVEAYPRRRLIRNLSSKQKASRSRRGLRRPTAWMHKS